MPVRVEEETGVRGFARCVTPGCPSFDQDVPLELRKETRIHRADDMPIDITSTSYIFPLDDSEYDCPDCARSRSITDQERREIPNHLQRMLGGQEEAFVPEDVQPKEDPAQTMARAILLAEEMRAQKDAS